MAEAIAAGIIERQVVSAGEICMTDISELRLHKLAEKYGVSVSTDNAAAATAADTVVLAVKPQVFPEVWPDVQAALQPGALVISIMAGIPSARIEAGRATRVVRVMPNTPALVGEGASGIAAGTHADGGDLQTAGALLEAVGTAVIVKEKEIDAVTALSGSGPAYVFYLLESMLEAADQMGLKGEVSRELALATVIGAARLMQETGDAPDALRARVTSKGGTTAAAVETLDRRQVKESVVAALLAAQARSRELADG